MTIAATSAFNYLFSKPANIFFEQDKTNSPKYGRTFVVLLASPFAVLGAVLDTVAGAIMGIVSTVFYEHSQRKKAAKLLSHSSLVPLPLTILLCMLTPTATATIKNSKNEEMSESLNGPFTVAISERIRKFAEDNAAKDQPTFKEYILKRHIVSRLSFALFAVSSVVTRVFDCVIGVVAFVLAVVTRARVPYFNHYAVRGLKLTGVIGDLVYAILKFVDPTEKFDEDAPEEQHVATLRMETFSSKVVVS